MALFFVVGSDAMRLWGTPAVLSSGDLAVDPELAGGSGGDALVVWDQSVGVVCASQPDNPECVHIVEAASKAPGAATFQAPAEIARPGVGSRPRGAVDRAGNGLVVMIHDIGEDRVLEASYRRGRSGVWPEPMDLSEVTRRIGSHASAFDAVGNVTVVWAGTDGDGRTVVYAKERRIDSGVWGATLRLSAAEGGVSSGPSLAGNDSGDLVALWTRTGPAGAVVQASIRPGASGVWSPPADLSAPGADPDPSVAIDGAGDAVAVWSRGVVESSYRRSDGWWSDPIVVSGTQARARDPQVALDAAGNAIAIWLGPRDVESAARSRASTAWSNPVVVDRTGGTTPRLAIESSGNAVAAWVDDAGATRAALRPSATGRWVATEAVSAAGSRTSGPRLVMGAGSQALIVWSRITPVGALVEAADLTDTGPLLTGLVVPASGRPGSAVTFAVAPVPWAAALSGPPRWDFGDGGAGSGGRTSHVYRAPGRYLVAVTQVDAAGRSETASSSIRIAALPPRDTRAPSVSGWPRVGAILTCAPGDWIGTPPIHYRFVWLRGRLELSGTGARRYRVRPADAGNLVTCRVVAANAGGSHAATARPRRILSEETAGRNGAP